MNEALTSFIEQHIPWGTPYQEDVTDCACWLDIEPPKSEFVSRMWPGFRR
jgi:hypothetical protein